MVAATLIQLVGDYMFNQRVRDDQRVAENLSSIMGEALFSLDVNAMLASAADASSEGLSRVLVLDRYGVVQVDAYSQTTGACGGIDFWGNCWEWTSSTDAGGLYIVKGGSWDSDRDDCRSEKSDVVRDGAQGYANVGFRVVRTTL